MDLNIICTKNMAIPITNIDNHINSLASRQPLPKLGNLTSRQINNIIDLMTVKMLNEIESANTYSHLDRIVLKLRNAAEKSHRGHNAKYITKP